MFRAFLDFLDEERFRRNTTYPVVVGLYGGMMFNVPLFTAFWIAIVTTMDPLTFIQSPLVWYAKLLAGFFYIMLGAASAYMYGEMASAMVSWLFGFYTLKGRSLTPKLIGTAILLLLLGGLFPYIALVGFMAIRFAFSDVGMVDPTGLLVGGVFVTVLGVIIPGLLSDPQTIDQKRSIVLTHLLEVATESAANQIRNNPALALKIVSVDELSGGVITDPNRVFDMLKPYPYLMPDVERLAKNGTLGIYPGFPEDARIEFLSRRKQLAREMQERERRQTVEAKAQDVTPPPVG